MKTKPDSIDFDMRSAGPDGQFVMRCKIARLLQQGENGNQISKRLGVSTTHIYSVRDLYQENLFSRIMTMRLEREHRRP